MHTLWHTISRISPIVVDAATIFIYAAVVSWLKETIFHAQSTAAGWTVAGFFLLLVIGVFCLNRLAHEEKKVPAIFGYPALGFGIVVFMMAIQALGMFDSTSTISDTAGGIFALVFLGLISAYMAAVLINPEKKIAQGTRRFAITQLFSLLTIALAMIMAGTYWELAFFESGTLVEKSLNEQMVMMLWMYPIFLLFFASPRLLILAKNFTWYGLASALGSIGYYVWVSMDRIAL